MKYRALDENGDYTVGRGAADFLVNSPAAVAQAVKTRLLLETGEWFLDITEGTPYGSAILGENTRPTYDNAIRDRIIETEGVTDLVSYFSNLNPNTRALTVTATINTIYGQTTLTAIL